MRTARAVTSEGAEVGGAGLARLREALRGCEVLRP